MTGPPMPPAGNTHEGSTGGRRHDARNPPRLPVPVSAEERARRLNAPPPARTLPAPPLGARQRPVPPPRPHAAGPGAAVPAADAPLPQLPGDVLARIVALADTRQLNTLRKVNHRFHRLANRRIERLFLSLIEQHAAELGFDGCTIGGHDEPLFRGDERAPAAVFALGFTKFNDQMPQISGELVRNVISTSRDAGIARRKYGFVGGYVYALSGVPGIDTHNHNGLEEIATLFVPPECVIAAIGPIAAIDRDRYLLVINDPEVILNPNCRLNAETVELACAALRQLCRAPD